MASQVLNTYVSQNVVITWGPVPIEAFADTYVNVSYDSPQTSTTQAPDGPVANTLMPATVGTIEVTLQQNSPSNQLLNNLFATQKLRQTLIQSPIPIVTGKH